MYEKGVATITVPDDRWGRCNIKTIALLPNCLAKERARRAGCYEAIFYSADGTVYEGGSTNVFCVSDGTILTAPLSNKILPGITRARLLKLARSADFDVDERAFTVDQLKGADEVFLTGTSTEVMPVVTVDDTSIGSGEPGPVSRQLRQLMLEHVSRCRGR
jgi:D-alanine transaminase